MQGGAITRAPNHSGALKYCGVAKKSQPCHTYLLQYSTFASGRPQVRKWGRQTCFLPRAPSNLVSPLSIWRLVPSRNPSTHFCCKTTMQTNCGLTNCTGNSPETGFSFTFLRLVKSWVINKFSTLHSYFYCCLSFSFQGGDQALKNKLVKKQTMFIQHSSKSRTANATAFVKAGQFSRSKEIMKQWNYYETIASFTLFGKRLGKVRHVNPDVLLSEKHCLF